MKKYWSIFLVCLTTTLSVQAQTMTTIFSKIPDNRSLLLDSIKRLDLMDMYKAGKVAEIKNNFGDTSSLQSFSEDYLLLKTGNNSLEIAILPMINDSKIVCLIQTVCAPACDSQVEFYTTEWKLLDTGIFLTPVQQDWFFKEDARTSDPNFENTRRILDINLMQFHYNKEKLTLTQTCTTLDYISKADREKIEPYLKNTSKVFQWKQTRFE